MGFLGKHFLLIAAASLFFTFSAQAQSFEASDIELYVNELEALSHEIVAIDATSLATGCTGEINAGCSCSASGENAECSRDGNSATCTDGETTTTCTSTGQRQCSCTTTQNEEIIEIGEQGLDLSVR